MIAVLGLAAAAALYVAGAARFRRLRPAARWPASRATCGLGGIAVLLAALAPPMDAYADRLLWVHMVQHLLLMLVAPPLLLLGRPMTLALAASRRPVRRTLARVGRGPVGRALGAPGVGFAAFSVALWASHFSSLYEATLTNEALHAAEHLVYLVASLAFWWPLVARDPGAARLSHPARLLYAFLAMPVMSLLGFVISTAARVLYPHYAAEAGSVASALADQRLAGTIMWGSSMLAGAVALAAVLFDWMERDELEARRADVRRTQRGAAQAGRPPTVGLQGG